MMSNNNIHTSGKQFNIHLNRGVFEYINIFTRLKGRETGKDILVSVSLHPSRMSRQIRGYYYNCTDEFHEFVNIIDNLVDSSFLNYSDMFCQSLDRNIANSDNLAFNYYLPIVFCFKKFMSEIEM